MPVSLAYKAYQLIWEALDWLYPPNCGGCGAPGTRWCEECSRQTVEIPPPYCSICGNPTQDEELCRRCVESPASYSALRSCTIFNGPIREAIHRYKYKHDISLGEALSRLMIKEIQKYNWGVNYVTSVPLGLVRFKERGYNQATLLARPISLYLGIPYSSKALIRTRETRTQVGLNAHERQLNMADAFRANRNLVQGKTVLLVDDVATSGATLNACAKALLEAGACEVYGFSLARAVFSSDDGIDIS